MDLSQSVLLKLDRGREHLRSLDQSVSDFVHAHPYRIVGDANDDRTEYHFRVIWERRPPFNRWAALLADGIQNLRSSLDHLVYAFAIAKSGEDPPPDEKTLMFPICQDTDRWKKSRWRMRGLPDEVIEAIRREQPHPDRLEDSALWMLEDFNNSDKHRIVRPVMMAVTEIRGPGRPRSFDWDFRSAYAPIEDRQHFAHLTTTRPITKAEADRFSVSIQPGVQRIKPDDPTKSRLLALGPVIQSLHDEIPQLVQRVAVSWG